MPVTMKYIMLVLFHMMLTVDCIADGSIRGQRDTLPAAHGGDHAGIPSTDSSAVIKERSWSFNGYVKDMQTVIVHKVDENWVTSNLIHNRLNFKWNISKSVTFCLEERNRFYWGELTSLSPQYKDFVAYDNGLVNMS